MRHVVQQSHVRKTNVYTAAIQRTKFKNPASLMRIQKKQRCKTFVLMFLRCIPITWIEFGRVWRVCMSTILRRSDASTKTHAMYARARAKQNHSDCKVFPCQLWRVFKIQKKIQIIDYFYNDWFKWKENNHISCFYTLTLIAFVHLMSTLKYQSSNYMLQVDKM